MNSEFQNIYFDGSKSCNLEKKNVRKFRKPNYEQMPVNHKNRLRGIYGRDHTTCSPQGPKVLNDIFVENGRGK